MVSSETYVGAWNLRYKFRGWVCVGCVCVCVCVCVCGGGGGGGVHNLFYALLVSF